MILTNFIENRQKLLLEWTNLRELEVLFDKYQIDKEMFQKAFGTRIIDYFISIFMEQVEPGNCPAIAAMLHFFQHKNLELSDIFILCDCLKEIIISASPDDSQKTFDIFRKNFAGVIRTYLKINAEFANSKRKDSYYCQNCNVRLENDIPDFEPQLGEPTNVNKPKAIDSGEFDVVVNEIAEDNANKSGLMMFMEGEEEIVRDIVDNLTDFCDHCFDGHIDPQKLVAVSTIFATIGLHEFSDLFARLADVDIPIGSCYMFLGLANDMRIFKNNLLDAKLEQSIISNIRQLNALLPSLGNAEAEIELF